MFLFLISRLLIQKLRVLQHKRHNDTSAIHTMLCHTDVTRYLIGIYSLLRFCHTIPKIIIQDDSSLTKSDYQALSAIPNATIVTPSQADQLAKKYLDKYPILEKHRHKSAFNKKLVDLLLFKNMYQRTLLFDSDIIFYRYPKQIIDFLDGRSKIKAFYIEDYQDAYIAAKHILEKIFRQQVFPRVNSGLLGFQTDTLTTTFVKDYYTVLDTAHWDTPLHDPWIEQTALSLFISHNRGRKLDKTYYLGLEDTPRHVICRHYVQGTRKYYLYDVLSRVIL